MHWGPQWHKQSLELQLWLTAVTWRNVKIKLTHLHNNVFIVSYYGRLCSWYTVLQDVIFRLLYLLCLLSPGAGHCWFTDASDACPCNSQNSMYFAIKQGLGWHLFPLSSTIISSVERVRRLYSETDRMSVPVLNSTLKSPARFLTHWSTD